MDKSDGNQPYSIVKEMLCLFKVVVLAGALTACAFNTDPREDAGIAMDHAVDLSRYAGKWFEFARTPNHYQDNRPSRDGRTYSACSSATATYSLQSNSTLSIRNACIRTAPDGTTYEDIATGIARVVRGSKGHQFKVAFGPGIARLFQRLFTLGRFNYWIIDLGGTQGTQPYTWAIVSGPDLDFIYFLTRTPSPAQEIKDIMLSSARSAGLPAHRLEFLQ